MRMRTIVLALAIASSYSGALIPNYASPAEANADFGRRASEITKGQVHHLKLEREKGGGLGDWNAERAKFSFRELSAGMYMFANPAKFSNSDFEAATGKSGLSLSEHRAEFQKLLRSFSGTVNVKWPVGTEHDGGRWLDAELHKWVKWNKTDEQWYYGIADYDMQLCEVITTIYAFLDRPDILPTDVLESLVLQNTNESSVPYSGQNVGWAQVYLKSYGNPAWAADIPKVGSAWDVTGNVNVKIKMPETENHVLMISAWQYLVNNLVRWIAMRDAGHPRYSVKIRDIYHADPQRYSNGVVFSSWLMDVLTRVTRRGLFETNGQAYESFSFSAISVLASNAGLLFPNEENAKKVEVAAKNAADYLAANYVFMSHKGKRNLSRRRKWDGGYAEDVSLYYNDYMNNMIGILSGSYSYDDRGVGCLGNGKEPYCSNSVDQESGFALMSVLAGYRLPDVLIDYALHPGFGWEAVSQTRYGRSEYNPNVHWCVDPSAGSYAIGAAAATFFPLLSAFYLAAEVEYDFCPDGAPGTPNDKFPGYGIDQPSSDIFSVKNRVVVTENYAVASGGQPSIFLKQTDPLGSERSNLKDLNTITVPYYLIPSGDVGWWNDPSGNGSVAYAIQRARKEALVGSFLPDPKYSSNMTTYKTFAAMPSTNLFVFTGASGNYSNVGLEYYGTIYQPRIPDSWRQTGRIKQKIKLSSEQSGISVKVSSGSAVQWRHNVPAPAPEIWVIDLANADPTYSEEVSPEKMFAKPSIGANYLILGRYADIGFWDVIPGEIVNNFGLDAVVGIIQGGSRVARGVSNDVSGMYRFHYSKPIMMCDEAGCSLTSEEIVVERTDHPELGASINLVIGRDYAIEPRLIPKGLPFVWGTWVDAKAQPSDFPLLEAKELDLSLNYTGKKLVETPEVGLVKVFPRGSAQPLILDSRDRRNPKSNAVRIERKLNWATWRGGLGAILQLLLD